MQKIVIIVILLYYMAGTFFLPAGNFHTLANIPDMYHHCKEMEHCDMNFIEFITDHLINIDGMMDSHEEGDEQKPHTPFNFQMQQDISFLPTLQINIKYIHLNIPFIKNEDLQDDLYKSSYMSDIFRPPIA